MSHLDEDFEDALDFVQEDEEGDEEQEEVLQATIAAEHEKFLEQQRTRQEQVRASRPWSAPVLSSPRPESQRQKKAEAVELAKPGVASILTAKSREDYVPPERPLLSSSSDPSALSYLAPPRPMSADTARVHRLSQGSGAASKEPLQDIMEDAPLEDPASASSSPSKRSAAPQTGSSPPGKRAAIVHSHAAIISSDEDEEVVAEEVEDEEEGSGEVSGLGRHEDDEGGLVEEGSRPHGGLSQSSIQDEVGTSSRTQQGQKSTKSQDMEGMVVVVPTHPTRPTSSHHSQALDDSSTHEDEGHESGSEAASSVMHGTHQPSELTDYGELLHPHQFAVQLLAHDLLTLPAHQSARHKRTSQGGGTAGGANPGVGGGVSPGAGASHRSTGSPPRSASPPHRASLGGASEGGAYAVQPPTGSPPAAEVSSGSRRGRPMSAPAHRGVVNANHTAFVDHGFSSIYAPKRGPYTNPSGGVVPAYSAGRAYSGRAGGSGARSGAQLQRPASAGPWSRPGTQRSPDMAAAGSLAPSEADDQVDVGGALALNRALRKEQRRKQKAAGHASAILSDDGEGDEEVEQLDGSDGEGAAPQAQQQQQQQQQQVGGKPVKWTEWYAAMMSGMADPETGASGPGARPSTAPSTGRAPAQLRPQSARPMYGPRHSNQQYGAHYESPYAQHYVTQFYGSPGSGAAQASRLTRPASAQPRPKPPPSASPFDLGMTSASHSPYAGQLSGAEPARASGTAAVDVAGVTVSVYVADTMKRVVEANRWMAQLGLRGRYRLKNKLSNMEVQVYDSTWQQQQQPSIYEDECFDPAVDAEAHAPTTKQLTLKQFLATHMRLKAQAAAGGGSFGGGSSVAAAQAAWGLDDGRATYSPGGYASGGQRQRPRSAQPTVYMGSRGGRPSSARGPGSKGADATQQPRQYYNPPQYITQQFGAHPDGGDVGGHSSTTYTGGARPQSARKHQGATMSAWEETATPARMRNIGRSSSAGAGGGRPGVYGVAGAGLGAGGEEYGAGGEEGRGGGRVDEAAERVQQQLADAADRCQAIVAEIGMLRDM